MDKHPQYFEGILQLRNPTKESLNYVENQIKKRQDVFIAKTEKTKNGLDYYISSNRFLKTLGKKMQKRFGGELKLSPKLYTINRQTSKKVYRLTVLVRLPTNKPGDIINYRGDKIKVLKVGKKIFGKNLESGRKVNINFEYL